jgi:hypothetical protein
MTTKIFIFVIANFIKISKSSIQLNPSLSISFDPFSLANKGLFDN